MYRLHRTNVPVVRKLTRATASGASVAAAMLLAITPAHADPDSANREDPARITITGEGSAAVAPDMAILSLGVSREAKTAREALDLNNAAMTEVIEAMKARGIEGRDLQTSNFSIQPRYTHYRPKEGEEQKPPQITGYVVSNNLTVRIRDLTKIGEVLDESVTLGVNTGGGINFTNDDPKSEITKARTAAMKDALDRANTLLEAAGASLGKIISINEQFHTPGPVPVAHARMMASDAAESVPLEAGENTYKVNVTVTWAIEQ